MTDWTYVHSEEIFNLMDEIIPSGSSLLGLLDDLLNNLTITHDELNETPVKAMKGELSRLDVEEECVEDFWSGGSYIVRLLSKMMKIRRITLPK